MAAKVPLRLKPVGLSRPLPPSDAKDSKSEKGYNPGECLVPKFQPTGACAGASVQPDPPVKGVQPDPPVKGVQPDPQVKKRKLGDLISTNHRFKSHQNRIDYIRKRIELDQAHFPDRTVYIDLLNLDIMPIELMDHRDPARDTFQEALIAFCVEEKLKYEVMYEGMLMTDDVDIRLDYIEYENWDEDERVEFIKQAKMHKHPIRIKFTSANA